MDEQSLRVLLARGMSVEEIGRRFDRHPSTVSYWMRKYELEASRREKHAAKGGIERVVLDALVAQGKSIGEIATEVGLSKGTVRHWLRRHGLSTLGGVRAREAAKAREAGMLAITRECRTHGVAEFVIEGRGYYRCKRCRLERVARHRRGIKEILVKEAGGACVLCGYDRCLGALQFHHLDRSDKRLEINCAGAILSLQSMRAEAAKCVLLCSNCHAEVERGAASLPVE